MSDTYNYTSPSRVKTLLVPVNRCTQTDFQRYLTMIRSTPSEVRLLDITPNNQLQFFNPQTFPKGRILLDMMTSGIDDSIFLHDFEPFRKTFVIIGIGKYEKEEANGNGKATNGDFTNGDAKGAESVPKNVSHKVSNAEPNGNQSESTQKEKTLPAQEHSGSFSSILGELKRLYPSSIVQNLILFDAPLEISKSHSHNQQVFFHQGDSSPLTALETIYCDISRNFLSNLDNYASSYSNITLRSPVSITDSHILTKTISQAQKRLSSGSTSFKVSFNSPTSSTTPESKSKPQIRQIARQSKLMGNFYLLAGKYQDALQSFTESLTGLKKCDDFLWLAGALEGIGICIYLLQQIGVGFQLPNQIICSTIQLTKSKLQSVLTSVGETSAKTSSENLSPSNVSKASSRNSTYSPRTSVSSNSSFKFLSAPDFSSLPVPECIKLISSKVSQFYNLSTNDFENMVPDIVYVESILRIIRYMIKAHLEDPVFFSKADILHEIERIFSLQLVDMNITDQCKIYCALASMYTDLGMFRKRAFILRTLLVGLLPQFKKKLVGTDTVDISVTHQMFEFLFSTYGIDKEPESSSVAAFDHFQSNWTSLQVLLLKLCMQISEAIKDYPYLLKICILLLTRFTHCLPSDDQIKLKEKIESIVYFSNRYNLGYSNPYWDPFVVRKVKLVSRSRDDLTPYEEYEKNENKVGLVDSEKNTSIFNPYNKVKANVVNREKLLIKDDFYQLKVQLQNPFAFDVEINDLSIVTEGPVEVQTLKSFTKSLGFQPGNKARNTTNPIKRLPFTNGNTFSAPSVSTLGSTPAQSLAHTGTLVIPANSNETFLVAFKALEAGELEILGFNITIGCCDPQLFKIVDKENFDRKLKVENIKASKDSSSLSSSSSSILTKLDFNLKSNNISSRVSTRSLLLTVIPPQPTLSLTDILVTNGWLMLLEGEKFQFSISLTNHSDELINYLSFSFWDSTIDPLSKKLAASGQLTAPEVYEIEWYLLKCKPFRILNKSVISEKYKTIGARSDIKIDYEVTAKRNMKELKIILEYSNKDPQDVAKSFVKSVDVPLNFTIVPSLEIVGCDVIPLFSSSLHGFDGNSGLVQENLENVMKFITDINELSTKDISDYCLLIIDVRNSFTEKLITKLVYHFEKEFSFSINDCIEPGKTSRLLLPVKRISNQDTDLSLAIPSLRNKQFIKNYSVTEQEEMKIREMFWLRSVILDNLQGTWESVPEHETQKRHGNIELRDIRFTPKMASILVYNQIRLVNNIYLDEEPNVAIKKVGTQYILEAERFYTIKTTIVNSSDKPIRGILRHLPFSVQVGTSHPSFAQLTIDRKILINGVLQNHTEDVGPADTLEMDLSFIILEKGEYEWGSVLDVLDGDLLVVGREPVMIAAI